MYDDPPDSADDIERDVLARCKQHLPGWAALTRDDVDFTPPRGFSTFTMAVRPRRPVEPPAVLYRHLEGKENAILDFADERRIYLTLAAEGIAATCHAYADDFRLEAFYDGRTLTRHDLADERILRGIGAQLAKFHALEPALPDEPFFDRLHRRWGALAREVLTTHRHRFAEREQEMCEDLLGLLQPETLEMVRSRVPDEPFVFCHNDTYHGNVMKLSSGEIRLLDFEFSCRNHRAFDFANLFAETVTRHGLEAYPHFDIADPEYDAEDVARLVRGYLAAGGVGEEERLVEQTLAMIPLSDFMYAMAALPLALEPVQKIQFIPYALRRYRRFVAAVEAA